MTLYLGTGSFHVACDCVEARASKSGYGQVISKNADEDELAIAHDDDWDSAEARASKSGHGQVISKNADEGDLAIVRDDDWDSNLVGHDPAHHNHHSLYCTVFRGFDAAFPISEGGFGDV